MYESYYEIKERPFQLTPNPNWFFASKLHKRALAYLQYGLTQGEGFIVITGDVGTGKTTIANQLLNQLNQDEIIAKQIVTSKLAPDDLIRMIASSFNLVVTEHNKASYLDAIYSYLKRLHAQHRRALLIVDEAQNLPLESIEELRMLSNFQVNGKPLLQSFLLGQNELNPIIQAPNMEQFRQRIIASSNLTALQTDETRAYIEFRLNQAGAKPGLIADGCYRHIQQFSRGIPRRINLLMDRVMLYGYLEELTTIQEQDLQAVVTELSREIANQAPSPAMAEPKPTVLTELNSILDSSLEQKVKLAKELDQLLKKQRQLLDTQHKER